MEDRREERGDGKGAGEFPPQKKVNVSRINTGVILILLLPTLRHLIAYDVLMCR